MCSGPMRTVRSARWWRILLTIWEIRRRWRLPKSRPVVARSQRARRCGSAALANAFSAPSLHVLWPPFTVEAHLNSRSVHQPRYRLIPFNINTRDTKRERVCTRHDYEEKDQASLCSPSAALALYGVRAIHRAHASKSCTSAMVHLRRALLSLRIDVGVSLRSKKDRRERSSRGPT